jgi:serine/threonine-protein kinase
MPAADATGPPAGYPVPAMGAQKDDPRRARPLPDATTRTRGSAPSHPDDLLAPAEVIASAETGLRYRVERLLGRGGFGQAWRARCLGPSSRVPEVVCIKASRRLDGWVREAYFGQVLEAHPRAIQVYDAFPLARDGGGVVYCLALELAAGGDLRGFLRRTGKGWPEAAARREIAGLLEVLRQLHRGELLHRDLTPMNVFVCEGRTLKLGDFGIVRRQADDRGIRAGTMNAFTAPSEIIEGAAPKWQARDDVYQIGQLVGMVLRGSAEARIRTRDVRDLPCSDHLKEVVHRCLGERRKRYESADELVEALRRKPAPLRAGRLASLDGVHLAFTGILSRTRDEAARAARRAGATVHHGPSSLTTVVVRGRPNPQQAAGRDAGIKLMEIKRLREKGVRITLLNEEQFWRLAARR